MNGESDASAPMPQMREAPALLTPVVGETGAVAPIVGSMLASKPNGSCRVLEIVMETGEVEGAAHETVKAGFRAHLMAVGLLRLERAGIGGGIGPRAGERGEGASQRIGAGQRREVGADRQLRGLIAHQTQWPPTSIC